MSEPVIISHVKGQAIPVRGNDIDTDRIIPARFLRCVVFDGLGEHAFEDDRLGLKAKGQLHAFDEPKFRGSRILFVNKNFGCGSSREHAPQALMRWGIQAVVGESFAEIFFGNCVALGIPCLTASEESMARLMSNAETSSTAEWNLDLAKGLIMGPSEESVSLPAGPKSQFLSGRWNSLNELLTNAKAIEVVAANLPYVSGW